MVKERLIIIFYLLYFGWLFTVMFLYPDPVATDLYTVFIAFIYLIFFRERFDSFFFAGFAVIPLILNAQAVQYTPLWMPLSWGMTAVALRKFVLVFLRSIVIN